VRVREPLGAADSHSRYGFPVCHCRHSDSPHFSGAFPIIMPGIVIPDSYFQYREPVPTDTLGDIERAKIIITTITHFGASRASRTGARCCKVIGSSVDG
jgi:hypothetical protein